MPPVPSVLKTGGTAGAATGAGAGGTAETAAETGTRAAAATTRGTFTCLALAGRDGAASCVACDAAEASAAFHSQIDLASDPSVLANMGSDVITIAHASTALISCLKTPLV
jgi:hypothetical protein